MSISRRWAVPAGVAAVVAAGSLVGPQLASAGPELPPTTAAQLLARLARAPERPFSGTVVQTTDLGFPKLPTGNADTADVTALLTGSTTVRVWSDGPTRSRAALIGSLAETDVVRNGRDVWTWNSRMRTAEHVRLPAGADAAAGRVARQGGGEGAAADRPITSATTPEEAARQALAAVDPSTAVTLSKDTTKVAGRGAYELVLAPRAEGSLIGQVRVAVDSSTSMPLRVQVYPRGQSEPAYQTGFTDLTLGSPGSDVFRFRPPAGSKVTERTVPAQVGAGDLRAQHAAGAERLRSRLPAEAVTVVGHDWTSVLVTRGVDRAKVLSAVGGDQLAGAVLGGFHDVSGSYGTGRLLTTNLVNVLWLDDGRLIVGAVDRGLLEAAARSTAVPPTAGR
jgi:outer membrane lipoprotein-sorting protein